VIIGGPLAFSVIAFLTGSTVGFLRYEIAAIPLLIVLAGIVLARREPVLRFRVRESLTSDVAGRPTNSARVAAALGATLGLVIALGVALSLPTALATLRHPLLAREEADALRSVLGNDPPATGASYVLATHTEAARVAAAIDALDLSKGSVLLDVASGNPIVLQSAHPDWFVITPDRDFARVLAAPASFGVRYLVVSRQGGEGALDALNRVYPDLYATGAGMATLVGSFDEDGTGGWRLYRMNQQ
jgi:hypothetical protein